LFERIEGRQKVKGGTLTMTGAFVVLSDFALWQNRIEGRQKMKGVFPRHGSIRSA